MATAANSDALMSVTERGEFRLFGAAMAFLAFYVIALPKGGIKIYGIPITFGYIFTTVMLLAAMLRANRVLSIPLDRMLTFAACLLLGLWSLFVVAVNGTDTTGFTISYFVSVIYLPLFGMIFFSPLILDDYIDLIEKCFIWAVRFIVLYGLFLFVFRQTTGQWIEIPYLTVNVDDVGELDDKYINRGGIFKLISTYNNGNIFGVSLAIMAPLYLRLEKFRILKWAMYAAMFLTLSRTVWIALILIMFLEALSKGIRPVTLLYLSAGLAVVGMVIVALVEFLGRDISFIFDTNLGGRAGQLQILENIRFFPEGQVSALPEIVYLGILEYFGVPGFFLFVTYLLMPPLLLWLEGMRLLSMSKASACMQGLLVYAVIAGADAAFSFIPVMMIFWMVVGLGFWYAHDQVLPARIPATKDAREAAR